MPVGPSFLVLGAGAMGCLFGGRLTRAGYPVVLIGRPAQARAINELGLLITGLSRLHQPVRTLTTIRQAGSLPEPDFILLTVKAHATAELAVELAGQLITGPWQRTAVVSLQNGLENLDRLGHELGRERVMGGLTSHGASLVDWGQVSHNGLGYTVVGELDGPARERTRRLARALTRAGIETTITDRLEREVWLKGLVNCSINPVAALAGVQNGGLAQGPLRSLSRQVCQEATTVARARGVELPHLDPWERVSQVIEQTADNRCSMLQDLERGRRTEIDSINGAIVQLGMSLGVPTPLNDILVKLVKGLTCRFG